MRSALRKHFFLINISPGKMENAIFAHLTKKSNYLKAEFLSFHQILF